MVELADIFRLHGAPYRARYGDRMLPSHLRAMEDIERCRTAALGGRVFACPNCADVLQYSYHSCGNRACPKCGNDDTSGWLDPQRQFLLPVDYFLVTYTLPDECRAVARANQRSVYGAFFRASAQTFIDLAAQPRHLHGLCGLMGVLQTWRRDLAYHPHIHYLVPGGALADDHSAWRPHRYDDWLLPERALAAGFKLRFQRELQGLGWLDQVDPAVWTCDKKWVVDAMPAGTGQTVLKYLAPYVHRVAISNQRILACRDGKVTFRFKARDHGQWRHMTLPVDRFIARFLQHVLPRGFVKVRYYGFLAAKVRNHLLPVIRQLLPQPPHPAPATPAPQAGPPPPLQPLHDRSPDLAVEPASDHGSCRQLNRTIRGGPDAGDASVAPPSPLDPHHTDDVQRPTDDRSWHRCPSCGRPLVLLGTLPRLHARPRDPPS